LLALTILLACPTAAIAAAGGEEASAPALDDVHAVPLAPIQEPGRRFERLIHSYARRIRAQAQKQRRELYANLPGDVLIETLDAIASCESGGDPTAVSADGSYRGKYQFDYGTWESVGGHGDPAAAPEAEQDYRAALLYARAGSSPWPVCG
jgi:Transglycosylase-like domain